VLSTLLLAVTLVVPDLQQRLDAAATISTRELIAAKCVDSTSLGHDMAVSFGKQWNVAAPEHPVLLSKKSEPTRFDARITLTFKRVDVDALLKSAVLPSLQRRIGFCAMETLRLHDQAAAAGDEAAQERWRNALADAVVAFRVETAPGAFQYVRHDGKAFVRAPAPTGQ